MRAVRLVHKQYRTVFAANLRNGFYIADYTLVGRRSDDDKFYIGVFLKRLLHARGINRAVKAVFFKIRRHDVHGIQAEHFDGIENGLVAVSRNEDFVALFTHRAYCGKHSARASVDQISCVLHAKNVGGKFFGI